MLPLNTWFPVKSATRNKQNIIFQYDMICQTKHCKNWYFCFSNKHVALGRKNKVRYLYFHLILSYLLTLSLFAGVSRVRALSPAWTGSHARETLNSCTHLFLSHDLPPTKKSSTIKSWPTFCNQYFWKFPIWNSSADEKRREIRMIKVFKWYPVIDLFDTFTGKLGHGD
jgi:hypothetical protein